MKQEFNDIFAVHTNNIYTMEMQRERESEKNGNT